MFTIDLILPILFNPPGMKVTGDKLVVWQWHKVLLKKTFHFFLLLPILLSGCVAIPKPAKESHLGLLPEIKAPQTLAYRSETYRASYSAVSSKMALVEYYRDGETPEHWTQMLALRYFPDAPSPAVQAEGLAAMASGLGGAQSYKDPNNAGYDVDSLLAVPQSHGTIEFNIFHIMNQTDGRGTKSFQYAERIPSSAYHLANSDGSVEKSLGVAYLQAKRDGHRKTFLAMPVPKITFVVPKSDDSSPSDPKP
ncbi:MAG: hypothetical protein QM796_10565 [Chthoniobacteraceae bacterium]